MRTRFLNESSPSLLAKSGLQLDRAAPRSFQLLLQLNASEALVLSGAWTRSIKVLLFNAGSGAEATLDNFRSSSSTRTGYCFGRCRRDDPSRNLAQPIFFLRLHRRKNQLSQQAQAANVAVIKSIRLVREKASIKPMMLCFAESGTASMERTPRRRHAGRFTRESVSASSQRTMRPDTRHSPENPEFGSSRIPASGAMLPAEARQTMASPSASAIATPSAPVIASARSATSCSTSSRTKCSSCQSSSAVRHTPSRICFARRVRICSCSAEKARRACKAS